MTRLGPRIVVAGTHSGVGKTSLALALVVALRRRGLRVQTFKVGPDFLDPTYLTLASGRPCYNLDGWMAGKEYVVRLFTRAAADADIAVIEGVMGLFDGANPSTLEGSTAEIAAWLDAPVLLVASAHGLSRSLAAAVKGYCTLEPQVRVAGVIANHCGSNDHASGMAISLKTSSLPPLVAAIPRNGWPELPSRHLGLVTADKNHLAAPLLQVLADVLERHGAIEEILPLAREAPSMEIPLAPVKSVPPRLRIAIARDEAFHFYYQDLWDELESGGCELVFFSPLRDQALPPQCQGLYLGGGYPEEHARALSANEPMLESIRRFASWGGFLYAECGGLMYLSQEIETLDGRNYPMAGLLPVSTRMLARKRALGYVEIALGEDSLWGKKGAVFRGHEFHYSEMTSDPAAEGGWRAIYSLKRRRREGVSGEGFQRGRVLASYVHLHLASHPEGIKTFLGHLGFVK